MDRICILALIGLPAVGKTSLSKLLLEMDTLPFNCLHINYDNCIKFKATNDISYKQQRQELFDKLQDFCKSLKFTKTINSNFLSVNHMNYKDFNTNKLLIICDDNHYYRSMRYKLYQMAREFNMSFGQLYIKCPHTLASERNSLRSLEHKVPQDVFDNMSNKLETPQLDVYEWEKSTLSIETFDINPEYILSHIMPFVVDLFDRPLKFSVEEKKHLCFSQSQVHNLDVILRKKIGEFLKSKELVNKNQIAQNLNEKKNLMLKDFQNNKNECQTLEGYIEMFEEFLRKFKKVDY